jgi:hypothetical protein
MPGEIEEPLDFHLHTRTVQPGLGEVIAECGHDGSVASVERAERLWR